MRRALRVPGGDGPDLAALDPRATPVGPKAEKAAAAAMAALSERLDARQEALFAEAAGGGSRAVLLVLQGMDTSGKGGVISHVAGLMNPQGLALASFKKPDAEELAHDFLWRIRRRVPAPGLIGVFDRSHYEDVLVVRVNGLVPEEGVAGALRRDPRLRGRARGSGVTVVKAMLHISPQKQQERLLGRLDDPAKRWKYNPGDLDVRARWAEYRAAYADALRERTPTPRPGTSSPPTASGTATGPSRRCSPRPSTSSRRNTRPGLRRRGRAGPRGEQRDQLTIGWMAQYANAAISAAIGMVSTHAMTMLPATPQRTADRRLRRADAHDRRR